MTDIRNVKDVMDIDLQIKRIIGGPPILTVVQFEDCLCDVKSILYTKLDIDLKKPNIKTYKKHSSLYNEVNENMLVWLASLGSVYQIVSYSELLPEVKERLITFLPNISFSVISENKEKVPLLMFPRTILVDNDPKFMKYNSPYVIVDRPWNKNLKGVRINPW